MPILPALNTPETLAAGEGADLSEDRTQSLTAYDMFVAVAAIVALGVLAFDALLTEDSEISTLLGYFDLGFCAIFFLDFIRNVIRAPDRGRYLRTWGIFDFVSSVPTVGALRILRLARLIRVLRALRSIRILILVARKNRGAAVLVAAITLTMTLFVAVCVGVLHVESSHPGSNIKTAEDVLWWAVVTASTVGYGDFYPETGVGRVLGALLMFVGIGLFAAASGSVGGMLIQSLREHGSDDKTRAQLDDLHASLARIERTLGSRDGEPSDPDSSPLASGTAPKPPREDP